MGQEVEPPLNEWLVVCDFDGTVTTQDAAEAILAEYQFTVCQSQGREQPELG